MKTLAIAQSLVRPKTLIASISPVLLAASFALKEGCFQLPLFALLLASGLMLQILSNIANDYFDGIKGTDVQSRVGPSRLTGSGEINIEKMKKILACAFAITLALGLSLSYYGGPVIALVFGVALICALLYTAGPYALSYNGLAEPFAFSFFGPIPCVFASYMFSGHFSFSAFLIGCLPGLYSLILITINNLRDFESDTLAAKKTLIVKMGRHFGKKLILVCLWSQILITLLLSFSYPKILFSLVVIPEAFSFYNQLQNSTKAQDFAPLKRMC